MKVHQNHHALSESKAAEKLAYTVKDLEGMGLLSRSQLYEEVRAGRLSIRKAGRKSLVLHGDLVRWLNSRPRKEPVSPAHRERALQVWKRRSAQVDADDAQSTPSEKGNSTAGTPRGAGSSSFVPSQADER